MTLVLICCLLAQGATAAYQRGLEAYSKDDLPAAEAFLKQARQADAHSFATRFLLGATLLRMNRADEAVPELEAAHKLNPRHPDATKLLAIQYMDHNRRPDALHLLQSFPEGARDEEIYLLLIEAHQDIGSVDEARRLVEKAAKLYPSSPRLNAWMGFEMRETGRFPEAQIYLKKSLQADPDLLAPYFLMGDVLLRTDKYQEALPWLRKAIEMHPGDAEAVIDLSRALAGLGQLPQAVSALEAEFQREPDNANLAVELSQMYARSGDKEKAHRQAEIAARLRKNLSTLPDSLRHDTQK